MRRKWKYNRFSLSLVEYNKGGKKTKVFSLKKNVS